MKLSVKLNILRQMDKIYDDFISGYDVACDRLCASCCTRNVTMTSLEGHRILKYIETSKRMDLLDHVKDNENIVRYWPLITTNQMAQMGYDGKEIPEEDMSDAAEACPILENDACPIYDVRPFGCRSMVSKSTCTDKGYAETDPFVITVNNVFMQFLEHIDEGGGFGNFTDVLIYLESKASDNTTAVSEYQKSGILKNHPLTVLLIPPEHRERIQSILESLQNIKVPKKL
jgi:Fe-S-cluster containining protein